MSTLTRLKLRLEFDGSAFCGWQLQSEEFESKQASIQGTLESAVSVVLRRPGVRYLVQGCGRTDAGVHAEEFFAHLDLRPHDAISSEADLERFRHSLNSVLPEQVVVTELRATPDFHAADQVSSKLYEYRLLLRRAKPVLARGRCHHLAIQPFDNAQFDSESVRMALRLLEGEHDFKAFAAANFTAKTSVRCLRRAELISEKAGSEPSSGELLRFQFEGDGFLKQQVRNMVGTLIEVGQRRREPNSLAALLGGEGEPGMRIDAGPCAPALGLYLVKVRYDGN